METFEKIISKFDKSIKVLDVGCFGHEGENTSTFLGRHFSHIKGFNINKKVLALQEANPNYEFVIDNFYDYKFADEKFDLIVGDLTIELNLLNDWCNKGLERYWNLLKDNGYLINFIMTTTEYGDPEVTPHLIKWHAKHWWETDELTNEAIGKKLSKVKGFELIHAEAEIRRPYITWVLLKKISGSSQ